MESAMIAVVFIFWGMIFLLLWKVWKACNALVSIKDILEDMRREKNSKPD